MLLKIVSIQAVVWLVTLLVTLLLARLVPPSPQISFAFAASNGYAGIRLFDLDHRLTAMLADTSSPVRTGNVQPPAYSWSPDGHQIVYEDRSRGTPRLMRRHITGAPELLAEAASGCNSPTWSTRDQIAYLCGGILYLIDGSAAPDARQEIRAEYENTFFRDPIWSADGTRLAHTTTGEQRLLMIRGAAGDRLLERQFSTQFTMGQLLDWSPDGVLSYTASESWKPHFIDIGDAEISEPQAVGDHLAEYDTGAHLLDFVWSPDNMLAAFVQSGRPGDLVIVDGQLQTLRQKLTFTHPAITELVWAADSRSLYVNRVWTLSRSDMARFDLETGELIPVTPVFDERIVNLQRRPSPQGS